MGVVRPPWISKEWFNKCPFNYCDHFGDRSITSKICKICAESERREAIYLRMGQDPYDLKNVFKDMAEDLANVMVMFRRDCERFGIDMDNLPDTKDDDFDPHGDPLLRLTQVYGDQVRKILQKLFRFNEKHPTKIISMITDVLAHSQVYVQAKTYRALCSRNDEERSGNTWELELADSKTSAFLAYLAVRRNSQALVALSRLTDKINEKERFLEFAQAGLELCEMIRQEFFPKDELTYQEIGCEEYDRVFAVDRNKGKYIN